MIEDDWESVPESTPLPAPIAVEPTAECLQRLKEVGVASHFNVESHQRDEGWLHRVDRYVFTHAFIIEGPAAFYGGPYAPNAWTGGGGLCAMGACSYSHSPLPEGVRVGRYCSIGRELRFLDFAHPAEWVSSSVAFFRPTGVTRLSAIHALIEQEGERCDRTFERRVFDPKRGLSYPQIGHDVWIGERVTLAMGIRIGTGAIIAAGSIVTRDVPPYAVMAGVPAQVKRLRFDENVVEQLLASRWWRYSFVDLNRLDVTRPERFLDDLLLAKSRDQLQLWQPNTIRLPFDWNRGDDA